MCIVVLIVYTNVYVFVVFVVVSAFITIVIIVPFVVVSIAAVVVICSDDCICWCCCFRCCCRWLVVYVRVIDIHVTLINMLCVDDVELFGVGYVVFRKGKGIEQQG